MTNTGRLDVVNRLPDEDRERAEVTEQLGQITRLRLQTLLAG